MKYIVEIPWVGVKKGAIVEFAKLHPALKANVKPLSEEVAAQLTPATPDVTSEKVNIDTSDKKQVKAKLEELGVEFDGRASLEDLVKLLP
ncbi:hypothetical protein [Vibrio fluvialis]|jgi:L-rhamnose isomerase|uniref:hypothetical protein n=1 Tax=Vibrio fluvialis TaxID=676 RepID=UPI001EEC5875|nr:hypothetical protein [Vibrio fluvialis]MCG6367001.1 hypothetical protein [Vibrio fluvialis]MCG6375638.1 hypothetical protein [Vibrio fluvialis]